MMFVSKNGWFKKNKYVGNKVVGNLLGKISSSVSEFS